MPVAVRQPLIAAHVPPEKKATFAALAARRGMTESALVNLLVDAVLDRNPIDSASDDRGLPSPCAGRVSLRLRPGDLARVRARAAARGMKPASYLSALIRAHVRYHSPLPVAELNALKLAVNHLSAVSRRLNELTRSGPSPSAALPDTDRRLADTLRSVENVRRAVADVVRINLMS